MSDQPQQQSDEPIGARILRQTNKVGVETVRFGRVSVETQGLVQAIADVIIPTDGGEESPVLQALSDVLLILRHQSETLERIEQRLAALEERASR